MSDGSDFSARDADAPVEIPLPAYLRTLQPHMTLRGWLLPLVFAVITFLFWDWSGGSLDWAPHTHRFAAYCFAVVVVFFVGARLWVGWRVRGAKAELARAERPTPQSGN